MERKDFASVLRDFPHRKKVSKDEMKLTDEMSKKLGWLWTGGMLADFTGTRDFEDAVDDSIVLIEKWKRKYSEVRA